jgi:hypothetical protein
MATGSVTCSWIVDGETHPMNDASSRVCSCRWSPHLSLLFQADITPRMLDLMDRPTKHGSPSHRGGSATARTRIRQICERVVEETCEAFRETEIFSDCWHLEKERLDGLVGFGYHKDEGQLGEVKAGQDALEVQVKNCLRTWRRRLSELERKYVV